MSHASPGGRGTVYYAGTSDTGRAECGSAQAGCLALGAGGEGPWPGRCGTVVWSVVRYTEVVGSSPSQATYLGFRFHPRCEAIHPCFSLSLSEIDKKLKNREQSWSWGSAALPASCSRPSDIDHSPPHTHTHSVSALGGLCVVFCLWAQGVHPAWPNARRSGRRDSGGPCQGEGDPDSLRNQEGRDPQARAALPAAGKASHGGWGSWVQMSGSQLGAVWGWLLGVGVLLHLVGEARSAVGTAPPQRVCHPKWCQG